MGGMNITPQANYLQIDQPIDPLAEYARAQGLKQQAQQMEIQKQQASQSAAMAPLQQQQAQGAIQQQQQEAQMRQMQLEDVQKMRQLQPQYVKRDESGKPTGFDWDGYANAAIQSGVNPQTVRQLQSQNLDFTNKLTEADKTVRDNEQAKNKDLYETIEGIKTAPDPNAAYQSALIKLSKKGISVGQLPPQFPGMDALNSFEASLGMHAQSLADAKTVAETKKASMGDVSQQELNSYLTAPTVPMESRPPDQRTPASFAAWKAKMAPAFKLDLANKASDPDIEVAAQALVDPKNLTALKDIASMRGDQRLKIFARARELDPNFDPGLVQRRVDFVKNYENPSGRAALNRQAINNILQHAGDLSDLNQQYRRANVRVINTPLNEIANQFGNTDYTKFSTTNSVLKDELALYFSGGYAPQQEQIGMWNKIQSDTATPAQTEAFAKEVVHLGLRRATTFNSQFHKMMGYDDPNMIIPEAKDAANKLGMSKEVEKFGSGGEYGQGEPKMQTTPNKPAGKFDWSTMPQH